MNEPAVDREWNGMCSPVPTSAEDVNMNAVLAIDRDNAEFVERGHYHSAARDAVLASGHPTPADAATELLRTIAEGLDIRSLFHRVSAVAMHVLPHDGLALHFSDRAGQMTLEARAPEDLPAQRWRPHTADQADAIVTDLHRLRLRVANGDSSGFDALITAGYRSAVSVGSVAQSQAMRLTFFAKRADAYTMHDISAAQHIANHVAVAVAHERLAGAERDRAEARARSERADARVRAVMDKGEALSGQRRIVGRSEAWQRVLTRALRVASTDTTVLLQGETGTGKEVVARFIHQASPRKNGPFIAINCAALPEQLLESELFGYERGAFTGALQPKAGQIELAARGVLFLDEVSEMSLPAQAKLLRVLQERELQRLGATRVQKADVRVVAATNRDLRQDVERGAFREDLFYRLQVFDIHLPELCERRSDIPLLAEHFLAEFAESLGGRPARLAEGARDALLAHSWPGNIRELRNVLESAAILSDGVIERRHLSLHAKTPGRASPLDLPGIERQTIEAVLHRTDGNKAKAARLLGLTRTQLYVRLRRHGIEVSPIP
jgi:transcriptional regulator with GAF, ATPase, and Fis domain